MTIKERDIRDIIGDWKLGEKFIMTKSVCTEDKDYTDKYVSKQFILLMKHTDYVVFVSDFIAKSYPKFVCVSYPIAVTAFKKAEKEEDYPECVKEVNNLEYFTDNDFFNRALTNADIEVQTIFHKTTIVAVRFANGFVMVESSSCVKEQDYNKELGIKLCMKKIEQKYMEHIAFEFCDDVYGWSSIKQRCEWD